MVGGTCAITAHHSMVQRRPLWLRKDHELHSLFNPLYPDLYLVAFVNSSCIGRRAITHVVAIGMRVANLAAS